MNEVLKKLKKYFNEEEVDELKQKLEGKQRANIINKKYFAKVGLNTDDLFFNNLIKEINLYSNNKGNDNLPNIIDYYIDEERYKQLE